MRAEFYHQTPAAILSRRRRRKTTRCPSPRGAPFTQGRALHPGARPPPRGMPSTQGRALHPGACPYQSVRQQTTTICTLPVPLHIAWGSLSLFVGTADPPSPLRPRPKRPTYPSTPLGYGGLGVRPLASVWTFGDHPGSQTEVRIKEDFTSVPESSWMWRKLHQKVQLFQREGGGMLYWPACWVAYKRKSWRAWFQSAAGDGHRHTPCGNNLNYTIWTLYAESVS